MKQASKRLISFGIGIALIVAAFVIFFQLVQPAYQEAQGWKAKKIGQENLYNNQLSTQKQVNALLQAYQGSRAPQDLVNMALPQTKDEADLVNEISVLSARYSLAVQNISISNPGARTASGKPQAGAAGLVKPTGVINAQIRVAGNYGSLRSFLSALESNIRLTDITGLAVTPVGKPNQDFYTFDIGVAAYYQTP